MKKIILIAAIFFLLLNTQMAQSVIQEVKTSRGKEFNVTTLGPHINNGMYEKAVNRQLGIIGNDYYQLDVIGTAPAEEYPVRWSPFHSPDDVWFPITLDKINRTSFKSTCVGILKIVSRRHSSDDIWDSFIWQGYGHERDDDWNFYVIPKGDIINKINMHGGLSDFIKNTVTYEIDVPDNFSSFFNDQQTYTPKIFTPFAGYGPLVTDQGHDTWGVEIHPAEQMWWTKQTPESITHYLISISDASERFDDNSDYHVPLLHDLPSTNPTWKGPWQKVPQESVYAIPFLIKKNDTEIINITEITSSESLPEYERIRTERMHDDHYFLTFNGETILEINYHGSTDAEFHIDNLGWDPEPFLRFNETIYKGFIIMKSHVQTYAGHQIHQIIRPNKNQHLDKRPEYKIDFDININSITCESHRISTSAGDGPRIDLINGNIGIISKGINQQIGAITPIVGDNILVDLGSVFSMNIGETKNLNIRKSYSIYENEEFYILNYFIERGSVPLFDPNEEIKGSTSTIRGAALYFNNIGSPNNFTITAQSPRNKILINGSYTVTKKTKIKTIDLPPR